MIDAMEQLIKQTEKRFTERKSMREDAKGKIAAKKIFDADSPERIQKRFDHLQINGKAVQAIRDSGLSFAAISTPGMAAAQDPAVLERILGLNNLMGIFFLELGLRISRSIARISIRSATGALRGYGTGFMISPRLLLTNNHVLDSTAAATHSLAEFNYQIGGLGQFTPSVFFNLAPQDFFLTNIPLDYTLVAVRDQQTGPVLASFGWNRLIKETGKAIIGEFLNIIQHPNGEPKQIALRENELIDVLDDFLHYRTDSAPGSSGSPVFNDQWEVVALHHSGVPRRDAAGNLLTRDNQIWESWMGEHRIDWIANEGARVSKIVQHLQSQSLPPEQKLLLEEMFTLQPPIEAVKAASQPSPRPTATTLDTSCGSVTWTIPLHLTVNVGPAGLGAPPTVPPPPPLTPVKGEQPPPARQPQEDQEVLEALAELESSRTRTYYDAEKDLSDRTAYFAEFSADQSPQELFGALNQLLSQTHNPQPSYKPAKHVYPWVDLYPDRKLRSIYSGRVYDPVEFIQEDFRISQERTARLREIMAAESLGAEALENELDLLEASLPYNCEHVVPQSWFIKKEPMRGDLHHLFACESECNSFRGNTPYFDFPDFEEVIRDECGKLVEKKFEPTAGKGMVARATLYFLLRYPGKIGDTEKELTLDRLPILLDWHAQFPAGEYEKHRNMAIFEKQGNRNPIIDFPELAQKIDFALGFSR
jgi:endonuclease I/V8-like Glu-specific endopeptidase